MRPRTFEEWRTCIVEDCGINLTKDFAKKRLTVYQDSENKETQTFVSLYGKQHLNNIVYWFKKIL
jgi:hypothetical protein